MGFLTTAKSNFKRPLKERIFSKDIPYPIYESNNNELLALNGEKSFCYELFPSDLDQKSRETIIDEYAHLSQLLNGLEESWLKFYRWGKRVFLSTNTEFNMPGVKLDNHLEAFFGNETPFSDINFFESYLTVNTQYWRLVHLQTPPVNSYESFLDDFDCDYVVAIKKIRFDRARQELHQKRRTQGVTLNTTHQNHEGEASYEEANRLLKSIETEGEGLFKVSVWFVLKSESFEALNTKTHQLIKDLKLNGAMGFVETSGLDYFFNHLLMGVTPSMLKAVTTNSRYLSNLIPNSNDKLHELGLKLFAQSGSEIFLDLYDEYASNQNWLITGASGEGKSFFAASLMYELFQQDVKIGIFDLGGSLRRMAKYLGGVDLTDRFNPLQFRCPYYLKQFVLSVIGKGEFTRPMEGQLFELISAGLAKEIDNFREFIEFISKSLPEVTYYFSELWEYFSDEETQTPGIFYLDTVNKPDALIAPYLVFAKELSERQSGKIVNFYDECWDIFDKCPDILRSNVKTGRKNLIGNIFLTQEFVELSQDHGDIAKAVIGNTYGKIYFSQPDLNHPVLTEFEKEKIKYVKSKKGEYSEFFFSSPDYKKTARLFASPLLYELCNSEKEQVKRQEHFVSQYQGILSYKESIDKWVRVNYE